MRWTKNLNLLDSLVRETLLWTRYFVTRKYLDSMQFYTMLLEQCGNIVAKDLATAIRLDEDQIHVCSVTFLDYSCLYVKLFLPFIFNSVEFWGSMFLIVLDIELTERNIIKKLGLFIDGSLQGFSFCPPKTSKPNKQTTWNTRHLHGNAWSSGKLDYEKLFAVSYDIKVLKAEVFAKGLEKCRLLTRLFGQIVKNSTSCQNGQFVDLL